MFADLLAALAEELDNANLPYMVIGGQAVLFHGEPRLTKDIDITVAAGLEQLESVLQVAAGSNLEPLVNPEEFTARTMVLPCLHRESGIRVDFILSFSPYEREAIERAVGVEVGNSLVRFATAEDLIVHKVLAGRARDLEDVRSILLKNPKVDRSLITGALASFQESLDQGTTLTDRFDDLCRCLGTKHDL
jgi:hypothetical protein